LAKTQSGYAYVVVWVGGLEVWEITILINILPYFTHRYWQMSTSMLVYPRVNAAAF
jgi:hypothetical protein